MSEARSYSSNFFSWIYPSRCSLCAVLGDDPICASCMQSFEPVDVVRQPMEEGPLRIVANLYAYRDRVGQAVRRLKYSRSTALAPVLAAMMAEGAERIGLVDYDLVVPIPIHWSRRCIRGFNQSELLAESFKGVVPSALTRIRRTKPQTQLSREERMHNLVGAFRASPIVSGKRVLLIDDVLTSGQTARECAKALGDAGAIEVAALALAGEAF